MTFERYDKRILKVQLYIEEHLDEDLSLETLSQVASTSPYHFHRIFKGVSGETVAGYVRRVRLEHASAQLKYTQQTVTEIAFGAGYQNHEAFTRAFHRRFGINPSQFRAGVIPKSNYRKEQRTVSMTTYEVKIKEVDPITVASKRHVGPYDEVGSVFDSFLEWAGQNGLMNSDSTVLGVSHDDPSVTEPSKLRYDCCLAVDDDFKPQGDIVKQQIAGGRYAVLRHTGPYSGLLQSYDWFFSVWLTESSETMRDAPPVEVYVNDPSDTAPEELVTDIYLPLA